MNIPDNLPGHKERNFPLRDLTTWKIGGPAEFIYWPSDWQSLAEAVSLAESAAVPVWIIGRGSNLLIADEGLPGLTIISTALQKIAWGDYRVRIDAGYSLARLAWETGERGWKGLEFASGIPGTVGGAIIMNAGAYGGEIAQSVVRVWTLVKGEVRELSRAELQFAYRQCSLRGKAWILEAEFIFEPGDRKELVNFMKNSLAKRKASQPLNLPNAGSVFRNPPGDSAGRLLEAAGWKGKSRGGARVSEKHANFIVNTGQATAGDVLSLIEDIRKDILKKFGIELESEIEYLGAGGSE
ncbi:MAG TPA: UDP-N-acetylmuramate dehydrogenase [Desulfitobacteriaceae bacterium]|nr:UDP-N-acetylmuramate dehydrogenase [Desulfitobacteriaceae bacterium]